MLRKLLPLLAALLLCALPALAEAPLPEVRAELNQYEFSAPGPVNVTITVTNTSDADMPPCALYDPDGRRIAGFGTPSLAAGEEQTWTGTWSITQEQLDTNKIVFVLAYTIRDNDGILNTKTQPYSIIIRYTLQADPLPEELCGTWTILYFIEDGVPVPAAERPDNGYALAVSPEAVRVLWRNEDPTPWGQTPLLSGNVITAWPDFTGTIVAPGLMTVDTHAHTLVLQLNAPDPWESPFAGDWQALLVADEAGIHAPNNAQQETRFRFAEDTMTELYPDGTQIVYAARYEGDSCMIYDDDMHIITATVDLNQLMTLIPARHPDQAVLLVPVLPE